MDHIGHGNTDWLILQLADSAFPAGAFAHSGGLESAWQLGTVRNAEAFAGYIYAQIRQITNASLPFVARAHAEATAIVNVDADCNAFLNNAVARRASITQGQAFVVAASRAFASESCKHLAGMIRRREIHGHWAVVFGALTSTMRIDVETARRLFLFINVRGLISAAVRLGIVGPLEAQAIQYAALQRAGNIDASAEPAQTSPLFDLWQGVQDRLYSRLFQS